MFIIIIIITITINIVVINIMPLPREGIHTAKDGGLSSYGYSMLAASYLQDIGALPALLHHSDGELGPYVDADEALEQVQTYL